MTPKQVRTARKKLGYTQAELADALLLSAANGARTIRAWESGEKEISGPASLALRYMVKYGEIQE